MRVLKNRLRPVSKICIVCMALLVLQGCTAKNRTAREEYRMQGVNLFKEGHYEEAEEAFVTALALSDGILTDMDFDISMYRALGFRKRGLHAEANAIYDNILAIRANDARALFAKGCCLLENDNISEAYRCFDSARQAAGGSEELRDLCVQIYRVLDSAGYKEAALNQLEAARLGSQPELTPVEQYNRTGLDHMARGEYEEAIEVFEAGLALQEEDMQQALLRNRIAAYEYAGNFGKAAELMEAYAARFPEDKMAARELVFLRTR